jgi:predicted small integral membrane protein
LVVVVSLQTWVDLQFYIEDVSTMLTLLLIIVAFQVTKIIWKSWFRNCFATWYFSELLTSAWWFNIWILHCFPRLQT